MGTQIDIDPVELDFTIHKGSTLGPLVFVCEDLDCNPVDLTDWSAYAEVRDTAAGSVILDLAPTITDATAGEVTIEKTDEQTGAVSASAANYDWDLILENGAGKRYTIAFGTATLRLNITQPA